MKKETNKDTKKEAKKKTKTVTILATPKTMTDAQALAEARKGGNIFGKAMYGRSDITMKLIYLESKEVIVKLNYQPAPLMKWLHIEPSGPKSQLIRMMVEGTRCTASYLEDPLKLQSITVDEDMIQNTEFDDEKIYQAAKRPAVNMVRRQIGKVAFPELVSMRSIYRPYYVCFFGEMVNGKKVRYLPIEADGHRVEKVL